MGGILHAEVKRKSKRILFSFPKIPIHYSPKIATVRSTDGLNLVLKVRMLAAPKGTISSVSSLTSPEEVY